MTAIVQSSAKRKLYRGIEQVKTLCGEARAFENADAYTLRTKRKRRAANKFDYTCFAIERQSPPDHWPLLAGEAIHNLRSSLNYAVVARWKGTRGIRGAQYPIFVDACEFQVKGRPMISGVPSPTRALIEAAQPFKVLPQRPKVDPLFLLSDFSNQDKHRDLTTVASAVDFPYVGVADVEIDFTDVGFHRELKGETQVMAFTATGAAEADDVHVDPHFTYQVLIEGRPLISILVAVARTAYRCLEECESGEVLSPFAPYPI